MKKNKSLIIILLIVVIGIVGLTLAYFTNTANITNEFKSKEYGTTVTEEFTSPDNWLPGSTEPKNLVVTNSGNVDEAVRVSYVETWTSKKGDNLSLTQNNNRAAIINWANSSDWTPVTENNKTYYYYNYKLTPGETTSTILDSVTFNKDIVNSNNCVETKTETGKKVECSSSGDEYDGATYKLVFKVETVQYDKYADAWSTNVSIAATKPLILKGLKYNAIDKTYENGDRSAMFAFSHPETEQMKATTDYRYIGNVPNNYVKFNCDDDGTNCEIWRIIGVFEVDDGTEKYETRIKLVRGSALSETMAWDTRNSEQTDDNQGKNEWDGSDINVYLNGQYYNSLSANSKNMIADAEYYLGSILLGGDSYETAEGLYDYERGSYIYHYNDAIRSYSWVGKIALMYPSDHFLVYGKGVDDVCYDDFHECYETGSNNTGAPRQDGYPDSGWIYNSNYSNANLEDDNNLYATYLITPGYYNSMEVFFVTNNISQTRAENNYGIRPVVYLKSSINIISGEGTEQNPYILG